MLCVSEADFLMKFPRLPNSRFTFMFWTPGHLAGGVSSSFLRITCSILVMPFFRNWIWTDSSDRERGDTQLSLAVSEKNSPLPSIYNCSSCHGPENFSIGHEKMFNPFLDNPKESCILPFRPRIDKKQVTLLFIIFKKSSHGD